MNLVSLFYDLKFPRFVAFLLLVKIFLSRKIEAFLITVHFLSVIQELAQIENLFLLDILECHFFEEGLWKNSKICLGI